MRSNVKRNNICRNYEIYVLNSLHLMFNAFNTKGENTEMAICVRVRFRVCVLVVVGGCSIITSTVVQQWCAPCCVL